MSSSPTYAFGPFELDVDERRLTKAGAWVSLGDRHMGVLLCLIAHAGHVVSKDAIIAEAWHDAAVTDNSLEQVISALRRLLGGDDGGRPYLETVPRQGYRFAGALKRVAKRHTDATLDALLAPHRAFVEGRAALETLERDQIARARAAFEVVLERLPDQWSAHVGLANACVMQFETTRADSRPDTAALASAVEHAREACRLAPESGEAWATLGFVLDRIGRRVDALAAARRAVMLEPDNWRHHFRLSSVGWGEERLGAAHRTVALLPGFALAHWMAATVHVARGGLHEAERELVAGIAAAEGQRFAPARFNAIALHWLLGLIALARGDEGRALDEFERELSFESSGHLYARECAANTWYAIGALRQRQGDRDAARRAFEEALSRLSTHPMARVALMAIAGDGSAPDGDVRRDGPVPTSEVLIASAVQAVLAGSSDRAVALIERTLAEAPPGSAAWLLPVEPMLAISLNPGPWTPVLAQLRARAA